MPELQMMDNEDFLHRTVFRINLNERLLSSRTETLKVTLVLALRHLVVLLNKTFRKVRWLVEGVQLRCKRFDYLEREEVGRIGKNS